MTPLARRLRTAFILALSVALLCGWRSSAAQSNASPAPAQSPGASQQPPSGRGGQPFRAGVELVSLNVTVNEAGSNRYATDLEQAQFEVFEDGVKQEVTYFTKANLPIALCLLLDTSASMESRMQTAQDAAIGFAKRLRQQDLGEVIDFDSRVVILQAFTSEAGLLEQAIRRTSAGGSTSMYNAVYIALKDLKKVVTAANPDDIRRQAIVLLSDGEDTSSLLPFEEVLDLAKRSETAIYAIGLRSPEGSSAGRGFKEAEFVLKQLAQETGGRAFFPNQISELAGVYEQISAELSSQYTLGYTSKNLKRDGAWRRVLVRVVTRPNLVARTKQGYFGPTGK
jgi:Ca-activated chloride channel homolog